MMFTFFSCCKVEQIVNTKEEIKFEPSPEPSIVVKEAQKSPKKNKKNAVRTAILDQIEAEGYNFVPVFHNEKHKFKEASYTSFTIAEVSGEHQTSGQNPELEENIFNAELKDSELKKALSAGSSLSQLENNNGSDRRTPVISGDLCKTPYTQIVSLVINLGNGSLKLSSGTLVGPSHVLTSAKNIIDRKNQGAFDTTVVAGLRSARNYHDTDGNIAKVIGVYIPEKLADCYKESIFTPNAEFDLAILLLDRPLGYKFGYLSILTFPENTRKTDPTFFNTEIGVAGYPGEVKHQGEMLEHWEPTSTALNGVNGETFVYNLDGAGGQIGSPFLLKRDEKKNYLIGVHSTPKNLNLNAEGCRISIKKFQAIITCIRKYFELLDNIASLSPRSKEIYNLLAKGDILMETQSYISAIETFKIALEQDPHNVNILSKIASVYKVQEKWAEAEHWYHKAIASEPKNSECYKNLGNVLFGKGDLNGALKNYQKAVELDSKNSVAFNNIGLVYENQGKLVEASEAYEKAVKINPKNTSFLFNLGTVLMHINKIDEAIDTLKRATKIEKLDPTLYCNLGIAQYKKGALKESIDSFSRSCELDANNTMALNLLGCAHRDLDQPLEALNYLEKASYIDSKDTVVLNNLGYVYLSVGRYEEAVNILTNSMKQNKENAETYHLLYDAYIATKRFKEAGDACRKAIKLEPKNPIGHANLGFALLHIGKLEDSVKSCLKAIELDSNCSVAHNHLALTYCKQNKFPEAIKHINMSLKINPNDPRTYISYGVIYKEGGKHEESKDYIKRAEEMDQIATSNYLGVLGSIKLYQEGIKAIYKASSQTTIERLKKSADGYLSLATTHIDEGRTKDGIAMIKKAIAADPKNSKAMIILANAYKLEKNFNEAIKVLKKASDQHPKEIEILIHLAQNLLEQGNIAEARTTAYKALEIDGKNERALEILKKIPKN